MMFHLTSGSRLQSFLFAMVRLVSALVTFLTLGFVYSSLEMWFVDKEMSFTQIKYAVFDAGMDFIEGKRSLEFKIISQGFLLIGCMLFIFMVLTCVDPYKAPYYSRSVDTVEWMDTNFYHLPIQLRHKPIEHHLNDE